MIVLDPFSESMVPGIWLLSHCILAQISHFEIDNISFNENLEIITTIAWATKDEKYGIFN